MRHPEHELQVAVVAFLDVALPQSIAFTCSLAGVKLTKSQAARAKAAGSRRGWPDLQFLFPDCITRYIELKAEGGRLTPEQKAFQARCAGHNISAVCRSVRDVEEKLIDWCAPLGLRLKATVQA